MSKKNMLDYYADDSRYWMVCMYRKKWWWPKSKSPQDMETVDRDLAEIFSKADPDAEYIKSGASFRVACVIVALVLLAAYALLHFSGLIG